MNTNSSNLARLSLFSFVGIGLIVGGLTSILGEQAWILLAACAGGGIAFAILKRRSLGLIASLVVALLLAGSLQTWTFGSGYSGGIRLPGLMALGLLGLTFLSWVLHTGGHFKPILRGWSKIWVGGFILLNLISLVIGIVRYGVFAALTDADWLFWLGFCFLVAANPYVIKRLIAVVYGIGLIQALGGMLYLVQGRPAGFLTTGGDRYVGTDNAQLVAAGFIISLILLFFLPSRKIPRIFIIGVALLQLFGVFISFNRQTWVALSFALLIGWGVFFRGRRLKILLFSVVIISIVLTVVFVSERVQIFPVDLQDIFLKRIGAGTNSTTYLQDSAIQFRFAAWKVAWSGVKDSPFLGLGWGSPLVFENRGVWYDLSPHNTYLWLAYKAGLPVLGLYLFFVGSLLIKAIRKCKVLLIQKEHALSLILMGAILIEILYFIGALWWDYLTAMYVSILIWANRGCLIFFVNNSMDRVKQGLRLYK